MKNISPAKSLALFLVTLTAGSVVALAPAHASTASSSLVTSTSDTMISIDGKQRMIWVS